MHTLIHKKMLQKIRYVFIFGLFLIFALTASEHTLASKSNEERSWIIGWEQTPPDYFYEISYELDYNPKTNVSLARPKCSETTSEWIEYWESNEMVRYIQPNQTVKVLELPNDPLLATQEYLELIGAVQAWDQLTGNKDITIAIVDTGADLEHDDLTDNLVEGINLLDPGKPPMDDNGHGTNLAGVLAATTNNNNGIAGILWNARIMPIKALGADGTGDEHKLGEGIRYAVDQDADIILLALGLYHYSPYLEEAVQYAEENGVLLVAAAGNEGDVVKYPAAFPTVLAVGGVNNNLEVMSDSNFGSEVDVVAPWEVYTTALGGEYESKGGTSMAAPQVAAAAALLWLKYPDFEPYQIRNFIRQSALDIGASGPDDHSGYGLLQIDRALSMHYQEDMYEPNNRQQDAARLPVNAEVIAVLSSGNDQDWFWVSHRYPGEVKLRVTTMDGQDISNLKLIYLDNEGNSHMYENLSEDIVIPVFDQTSYVAIAAKEPDMAGDISYQVVSSFQMESDPFEDNDEPYKAYVLPNRDQTIRGTFHQSEDQDWFVMYIEQEGTLKVRTFSDTNRMDLELLLQQGTENPLIFDWGSNGESEYSGPIEVKPGKYYIRVRNYHSAPVAGYYFLNIEYKQAFQDPNEPNNKSYQATPLVENIVYQGVMDEETDEDWFTFTVKQESAVHVNLTNIPEDRMMSLKLYDSSQTQLSIDVNMLGHDKIEIEKQLQPGKYYIRLSANQAFNYQMYQLEVESHVIVSGLKDIAGHWAEEWIVDLKEKHLMDGYDDGYFYPDQNITRAEAASVIAKLVPVNGSSDPNFSDVSESHWAYRDIALVTNAGIFTGYPDGSFQPEKPLTRVEMTILMAKLLGFSDELEAETSPFSDITNEHWAFSYVIYMEELGWISGYPDKTFRPNRIATRAEFASFISRVVNSIKEVDA